jgi:protein-disulfide isomerase
MATFNRFPLVVLDKLSILLFIIVLLMRGATVVAQPSSVSASCGELDVSKKNEITAYVAKRFKLSEASGLHIVSAEPFESTCLYKVELVTSTAPRRELTFFLSPDRRFLTPTLYDMTVDPSLAEEQRRSLLMKALVSGDPPARGLDTAPVTLVEFVDFQCPACKHLAEELKGTILPKYGSNLRVIFRAFPLPSHDWARDSSRLALCVRAQNANSFWQVYDYLYASQAMIRLDNLYESTAAFMSANSTLDVAQLKACFLKDQNDKKIQEDIDLGLANGVHVSPTLFINGVRVDGVPPANVLDAMIASALEVASKDKNQLDTSHSNPSQ